MQKKYMGTQYVETGSFRSLRPGVVRGVNRDLAAQARQEFNTDRRAGGMPYVQSGAPRTDGLYASGNGNGRK